MKFIPTGTPLRAEISGVIFPQGSKPPLPDFAPLENLTLITLISSFCLEYEAPGRRGAHLQFTR